MNENLQELANQAPEYIATYGVKIVLAIVIFFIGKWLARSLANLLNKGMAARGVEATIASFTRNLVYYALLAVVIIVTLGQIGIQTASFVAIIGAAGLAVGLALQGSLANFAAGVLLIAFRPFKVGDFVEAAGTAGVVHEISIFSTILKTGDNKRVICANAAVMGGNITNFSAEPERRVDFLVGVSYSANLDAVRKELEAIAAEDERIIADRDITIGVSELADSSVNFVFRVWVNTADYWAVFFDTNEKIKKRFDAAGIEIPFPQMDVHVNQAT